MRTHLEGAHERLVYAHHGSGVIKLATVVRSGEQRDQLSFSEELIAILHHLRRRVTGIGLTAPTARLLGVVGCSIVGCIFS